MMSACRMGSALLSRFDLVFILLDKPDEVWQQCVVLVYSLHCFKTTLIVFFAAPLVFILLF